jgi:hypothetical protein
MVLIVTYLLHSERVCGFESNTEYTWTRPLTDALSVVRMKGWIMLTGGKPKYWTTVPAYTAPGANQELCSEDLAYNVIYGMPQSFEWFTVNVLIKYLNHHGYVTFSCNLLWLLRFPDVYTYV